MGPAQREELPGHLLSSHLSLRLQSRQLVSPDCRRKHHLFALVSHYHLQAPWVMALAHCSRGNWGLGKSRGQTPVKGDPLLASPAAYCQTRSGCVFKAHRKVLFIAWLITCAGFSEVEKVFLAADSRKIQCSNKKIKEGCLKNHLRSPFITSPPFQIKIFTWTHSLWM